MRDCKTYDVFFTFAILWIGVASRRNISMFQQSYLTLQQALAQLGAPVHCKVRKRRKKRRKKRKRKKNGKRKRRNKKSQPSFGAKSVSVFSPEEKRG